MHHTNVFHDHFRRLVPQNVAALKIAKTLVEEQLVACVNIISQNQSVYMCGWPVPMTEESGSVCESAGRQGCFSLARKR